MPKQSPMRDGLWSRLPRFARNDRKDFALTDLGAPCEICASFWLQSSSSGADKVLYTEPLLLIRPGALDFESGSNGHLLKLVNVELIGTLRPNALALNKRYDNVIQVDSLLPQADKVQLDPTFSWIVEGIVLEPVESEITVEITVDSLKQIKVESRGYTAAVVIGTVEHAGVFLKVDADE